MSTEEILTLRKQGKTIQQIRKELHIHHRKIMKVCRENGMRFLPKRYLHPPLSKPTITIPKEEWKLGYQAALVDGEGTIENSTKIGVIVANTSTEMIDWILKEFGGHVGNPHIDKRGPNRKPLYRWRVESYADCMLLLRAILPYLTTKKEKAQALLSRCEEKVKSSYLAIA